MKRLALLAALASLAFAIPAKAATVTYDLNIDHCTNGCFSSGSVGTAIFADTLSGMQVSVQLTGGFEFQFAGVGLNTVNFGSSTAVTASAFSFQSSAGTTLLPVIPSSNQDGFGDFAYAVNSNGPPNQSAANALIQFTVAGMTVASLIASLNGSPDVVVAVDIFGTNGNTGLVGGTLELSQVPLPPAFALFASGIIGIGVLTRRRRKA